MHSQRGNILFLILLAVVLFAALSYAVTNAMKGGGNDSSEEKAKATTAAVLQQLVNTEVGLQRFLLTKNYKIEQIDLYDAALTLYGNNTQCNTAACNLFDPAGGGVSVPILPLAAKSAAASSGSCTEIVDGKGIRPRIMLMSVTGAGTTAGDIVLFYCGISDAVCTEINLMEGARQKTDAPLNVLYGTGGANNYKNFAGDMSTIPFVTADQSSANDARAANHRTICGEGKPFGEAYGNLLFHVIHAR